MKKSGICPQCGANDILYLEHTWGAPGSAIPARTILHPLRPPIWMERYVCASCGYIEEWVDEEDLPALKERYIPYIPSEE